VKGGHRIPIVRMPFGRHKGLSLDELPDDYLDWLCTIELREPLRRALLDEVARRREAGNSMMPALPTCSDLRLAEQLVDFGFRALAKHAHPDVGGSHDAFVHLQNVREWLRLIVRSAA
jgi:hypothetical protein